MNLHSTFGKLTLSCVLVIVIVVAMIKKDNIMMSISSLVFIPRGEGFNHNWKLLEARAKQNPKKRLFKRILFWTKVWGAYTKPFDQQRLQEYCNMSDCITTNDKSLYYESDMVIFHWFDMPKSPPKYWMPPRRPDGQIWTFFFHESPQNHPIVGKQKFDGLFNATATYRYDADIVVPIGTRKRLGHGEARPSPNLDYSAGKTQMVAWFVSNCNALSKRQEYAQELKKHIPVHIYGACGSYKCSRSDENRCHAMLSETYWFYLAFENSLCKDYITEKLWYIFLKKINVVPVVLGAADYSKYAPPNSFIDVRDFKSPKALANFLLNLTKDRERYNRYFAWRQQYKAVSEGLVCKACDYLKRVGNTTTKFYPSLQNWWTDKGGMVNPEDFYKGIM